MSTAPLIFGSLRGYQRSYVAADVVAGLTLWAVVVPEALAYASIAGVSPVVGLYAVAPAAVAYALFGSSRHLVVGPMSATAALSAAAVSDIAGSGALDYAALTAALAIVTGVVALAAGLLRLGFIAGFISEPVLKGFIIGMALTIIAGQAPKLIGVEKTGGNFFEQTAGLVRDMPSASWITASVAGASLVLLVLLKRFAHKLPGSLIVVLLAIAVTHLFKLDQAGVAIVGEIPSGLAPLAVPAVPFSAYLSLLGAAGGVAVVGFAEGLGAAKEYAARAGYEIDANRELIGLGVANIASGFSSGMVVNGSLSKTAVNGSAGAKSQISGLVAAAMTLLTLLFLTSLFQELPEATLAAVVIVAVVELVDIRTLKTYWRLWSARLGSIYGKAARVDFIGAIAALVGVLVFDTLPGLVIGVLVSLVLLAYRASRPHIAILGRKDGNWVDMAREPDAEAPAGVVVARVEGTMFFADSDAVRSGLIRAIGPNTRGLVLDVGTVPAVDMTAARMLDQLATGLRSQGIAMCVAAGIGQVREMVELADGADVPFGSASTIDEAVARVADGVDRDAPSR